MGEREKGRERESREQGGRGGGQEGGREEERDEESMGGRVQERLRALEKQLDRLVTFSPKSKARNHTTGTKCTEKMVALVDFCKHVPTCIVIPTLVLTWWV